MKQIHFKVRGHPIHQFPWMTGLSTSAVHCIHRQRLSTFESYSLPCWSSLHFDPFESEGFHESLPVRFALGMVLQLVCSWQEVLWKHFRGGSQTTQLSLVLFGTRRSWILRISYDTPIPTTTFGLSHTYKAPIVGVCEGNYARAPGRSPLPMFCLLYIHMCIHIHTHT